MKVTVDQRVYRRLNAASWQSPRWYEILAKDTGLDEDFLKASVITLVVSQSTDLEKVDRVESIG